MEDLRSAIRAIGPALVAKAAAVPIQTVSSYLTKPSSNPRGDTLEKLRAAVAELSGGSPPVFADYLPVPVFDIRAAAGAGALVEDGLPTSHHPFQQDFLRRVSRAPLEKLAVIQVSGDSMWETLHDGDAVLVDRSVRRVVKDGIYILLFEDELLVKRCQRDLSDGSLIVKSDNPRYDAFRVTEADRLNVIGRVIWIGRALG